MAYSMWKDETENSFEKIIENINNYDEWYKKQYDSFDNEELKFKIVMQHSENQTLDISDSKITYNIFNFENEKVRPREKNNPLRATRVQTTQCLIIVFNDGVNTKYIIDRTANNTTKSILRKINNYTKQKEIIKEDHNIDSDFFFWVVYKMITNNGKSLGGNDDLNLKLVTGFKGSTDDKLAEVTGTGDRVLNLISTLTFILENEKLNRIEIVIDHLQKTYGLSLGIESFVDVDTSKYVGEEIFNEEEYKWAPKVILYCFLMVIPDLLASYDTELEVDSWGTDKKKEFMNEIGEDIRNRINDKLKS